MSLIKNAQIISTLSERDVEYYTTVQQTLGLESIVEAVEQLSSVITPHDYQEWLRLTQEIADEDDIDLSRESDFQDLAWELLDNDPKIDAIGGDETMKQHIINTLWHAYNTNINQQHANSRIGSVEDEEVLDKNVSKHIEMIKLITSSPKLSKVYASGVSAGQANKSGTGEKPTKSPYASGTQRDKVWKAGFQHGTSGK